MNTLRTKTIATTIALLSMAFLSGVAHSAQLEYPTFQKLMDPAVFPDAQMGMKVESARVTGGAINITTTGARIRISTKDGVISFRQRIGHERPVAILRLGQALVGAKITHKTSGMMRVTFDNPKLTIRVNGDSLLMLQPGDPLNVSVDREIPVAWDRSWVANHLIVDQWGGFALYCSERDLKDSYDSDKITVATYPLPASAVLCLGVCPPKPYDWKSSLRDQTVWHWSDKTSYVASDIIRGWSKSGNVLLLQAEAMLWKQWNLDFIPRLGYDEFYRVRDVAHASGMRVIVYTSPFYFVKGTDREKYANDIPGGGVPGTVDGENIQFFQEAIQKVVRDLKPDGLYYDGVYANNPAAVYQLARMSRAVIGDKRLLEWHTTFEVGYTGEFYMPHADAYTNYQLRGEGHGSQFKDYNYLRFFVSGYNISNTIGVLCNNVSSDYGRSPNAKLVDDVLLVNARFHSFHVADNSTEVATPANYRNRLARSLKPMVDRDVDAREAQLFKEAGK